ncbi:MAG: glycosyltransferase family 4 protein, partial [Bacteroidetes bacterium]
KNKDWKLVLVGYDHLKQSNMENLKKLAEDMGVADQVIFAGKQSEVEKFYLKSKIFAFTSSSEGFPNAIGEAMSAGLAVIAYDCVAGPSEMITHDRNGFLIPLFDDDEFKSKLELLMEQPELREKFGQNGKEYIAGLSIKLIGEKFYQFITSST